ncbi:tripartite tricarboxylate transporter TctB family protein [Halobacillus fulvus]|nr:tripartite tricarboxylate transporter TctB family protein [Halobacillus fulvus]
MRLLEFLGWTTTVVLFILFYLYDSNRWANLAAVSMIVSAIIHFIRTYHRRKTKKVLGNPDARYSLYDHKYMKDYDGGGDWRSNGD